MPQYTKIRPIPQINISSSSQTFDAGRFDNAYIRSLNLDIGLSDNPTSINLSLINENGNYRDYPLSYLDPYNLQIGKDLNIICYLISQKKSKGNDSISTEIEFVDGSHILDRVFVGGVGVHTLQNQFWNMDLVQNDIPVACAPCYTNSIIGIPDPNATEIFNVTSSPTGKPNDIPALPIYTQRFLRSATKQSIGNNQVGGYIFLGDEKFTATSCDIPEIDYTFQDLIDACAGMNINIAIEDISRAPIPFTNPVQYGFPTLRKSHFGTLREVLKSWCADFGIDFTYDYTSLVPTVLPVDLKNGVTSKIINSITATAKIIKAGNDNNGSTIVEKIDENKTIKGSFQNNIVTSYKRKRLKRSFKKNTFYGTGYKCFQTSDVLSSDSMSQRTGYEFNTSCYLAKYNQNIRTLYLTYLAGLGRDSIYAALGFTSTVKLQPDLQKEIIDECLNTETYREITSRFTSQKVSDFDMIIGTYSEEAAKKHQDFEKSFAENFLGKWWFTNLQSFADGKFGGYKECFTGADWRYSIESSMSPDVEYVSTNAEAQSNATSLVARVFNQSKLPFKDHLWGPIPKNPWSYYDWFSDPRLKIYNRSEAPWSTTQEQAEAVFQKKTSNGIIDLAEPFLPIFQEIKGVIETRLKARFGGTSVPIGQVIDNVKKESIPCIMIAPKPERLAEILEISIMMPMVNDNENPFNFKDGSGTGNKLDCSDSLRCEIQNNLETVACNPERRCAGYPKLPPASVTTNSGIGKIYAARDNEPWPEGVMSKIGGGIVILFKPPTETPTKQNIAAGLTTSGPPRVLKIVGPAGTFQNINDIYLANYIEDIESDHYSPKIEEFLGDQFNPPGNVSEVKITLNNVSSDDPVFATKNPLTGKVEVLTKVYLRGYGFLTLQEYHNMVKMFSEQGNLDPIKHDLTVNLGNIDFGPLARFLNPQSGLTKLSCSIDDNGISASAGWSNRSGKPPAQDLFTSQIEPQLVAKRPIF